MAHRYKRWISTLKNFNLKEVQSFSKEEREEILFLLRSMTRQIEIYNFESIHLKTHHIPQTDKNSN